MGQCVNMGPLASVHVGEGGCVGVRVLLHIDGIVGLIRVCGGDGSSSSQYGSTAARSTSSLCTTAAAYIQPAVSAASCLRHHPRHTKHHTPRNPGTSHSTLLPSLLALTYLALSGSCSTLRYSSHTRCFCLTRFAYTHRPNAYLGSLSCRGELHSHPTIERMSDRL